MEIVKTIKEVREKIKAAKIEGKSVGFVPTMGFLHEGHLSLIRRARRENDLVIVSIFVNPTQFGPNEDFESYPRDLDKDSQKCKEAGADLVFAPSAEEMYVENFSTFVEVEGEITKKLCGASRPVFFKGITTVVTKLFNIVLPHRAYFGQKDAQQVAVIKKMVRDLNFDIEIVPCPLIREEDGLAMSSRNIYLNEEERKAALILSKSLFMAKEKIEAGEREASKIRGFIMDNIKTEPLVQIDYVEIVDGKTLERLDVIKGDVLIALAANIGKARMIDNISLEV